MNQPFDDTVKRFYRRFFEQQGIHAIQQFEVFARGRAIDLLVECTEKELVRFADTVFKHLRLLNSLEFKGYHDPLTAGDLNLIYMRAWGVGATDKVEKKKPKKQRKRATRLTPEEIAEMPSRRTGTIVCVRRPTKILNELKSEFQFEPTTEVGIYCCPDHKIPLWIIHPTELTLEPKNYALLALARGKKLEQFIELCMAQGLVEYLQLILDVGLVSDPDVIWQKIMEVYNMKVKIHEKTWPYIDEFFRKVPEAMQKVTTFQDALAASEQRGELRMQQQTLIRILRHKFGETPPQLIQTIEATDDPDRLNQWLDQALDAQSLADLKFTPGKAKAAKGAGQ